jgi:nitrite reductase (NADH) large subunit
VRQALGTVAERHVPPPVAARCQAAAQETLVVVGNGMVGHHLCRRLVELGATARFRIIVFGEEPHPAYDRVHLTEFLAGRGERDLLLAPRHWYEDNDIELCLNDPIVEIDRESRTAWSESGRQVEYARLVLATGSSPHVPPMEGADLQGVLVYRTIRDLQLIRARARHGRTAAVIGGGLLGLEAARALQQLGLGVTVLEAAASLMPAQLDQRAGKALERQVAALGIEVRTATMTKRVEPVGRQHRLHLAAGGTLTVDLLVIAAGVRPRTELAARCGLATSREGGVIVDDRLRTSDPRIFAIGECASHRARVYGLVAPGYDMADVLARHLIGKRAVFCGSEPATRLKLLGVEVATAGDPLDGSSARFETGATYRLLRIERGRLTGALGVGEWTEFTRIQDAVARRARVWPWQAARFERTGRLWRERQDPPVTQWPAEAVVCNCMNVTRGQLSETCRQGAATVEALSERTAASTLCGSCRPLLAQLVAAGPVVRARIPLSLLVLSLAASTVAVAIFALAPVPFAASIEQPFPPAILWRSGAYRQISGFTLLGLTVLASLLSLRKRVTRLSSMGAFPTWRIVHAALGVLTLLALAAHTGPRLGDNLNFALMASFGALNVIGGVAGALTALEQRLGARLGRKWRATAVTVHVLAIWPLPALIALHVLSVYYF